AAGRVAGGNPGVPYGVDLGEGRHVDDIEVGGEQLALVRAGFGQQGVDLGQYLPGLVGDRSAGGLGCDLTGEIDGAAVDHGLAHAGTDFDALDRHWISFRF